MKCPRCDTHFRIDDARMEFESNFKYKYIYDDIGERLCGSCSIGVTVNRLAESPEWVEQEETVVALISGMETMDEEEFEDLYNQLDDEHKMEVYEAIQEFAANAVGDEHWDSDN
jgi:hypothetical protein